MANEFVAKNGLISQNNTTISGSLIVTQGITGSLQGTATTSSYVNTLNQNVTISGSTLSIIPTLAAGTFAENALVLGPASSSKEGGQIAFLPASDYVTSSFIDNYNDHLRILKGTGVTSSAEIASWDLVTQQYSIPAYTSTTAFTASAVAGLAVNSSGDVVTTGFADPLKAYQAAGSNIKAMPVGLWANSFTPAAAAQTNQTLRLNAVYLPSNEIITGVRWYQAVLQSGATPSNYNGFGLYTLSGTTLTCQISSSNSTTIWSGGSANSYNSIAFDTTYRASPGLYYIGFLYSISVPGTVPTFGLSVAMTVTNQAIPGLTTNNKLTATLSTQTSMPTSIAMSTTAASNTIMNVSLY